jgi:signal transduction histidine kinase
MAAALAAVLGLAFLSQQPARFQLQQQPLATHAELLLPVDALGVAHHDFAYVSRGHDVVLERLMYGSRRRVWQTTLTTPVRLTGALDVTGNGLDALCLSSTGGPEPVAIVLDRDGQRIARLHAPPGVGGELAAAGDELVLHLALSQDGRRKLLGSVSRTRGAPASEVLLFDLSTGQPDWRVPLSTAPSTLAIADLDGDGRSEFLLSTCSRAPGSSDHGLCSAIAIRESGTLLWSVPLAVGRAIAGVAALGRSERSGGELVVASSRPVDAGPVTGRIAVIDGPTGRVLVTRELRSGLGRPIAVGGAPPRVAIGSRDGVLRVFDENLELQAERSFGMPIEVEECADLNRDGRQELIAATPGRVVILDERLRTRAELRFGDRSAGVPDVRLASAGFGNPRLVVSGSPALVADVTAIPPLTDPMKVPVVVALALVAGAWTRWRIRGRSGARSMSGAEAREFLLDYHQIRHETFGRERPFARVRLWAQAQIAGHPLPAEVLESARDEYHRIGAPTLMRFARRAADLGVARDRVRRIETQSREVEEALTAACPAPAGGAQHEIESALATMTELSEECLAAYREVALRDVCRPDHEAQEAILAKRGVLDQQGVALDVHVDPSGKQPVLFDSMELRALIGELIENAAHALAKTSSAEIRVLVAGKPGDARWVVLRIEDNGPGIPSRERVFAPGGSDHQRAREIAHRWLADLAIEPGAHRGAVVRLSLRSLLPHDVVAARDVPTHPPLDEDA